MYDYREELSYVEVAPYWNVNSKAYGIEGNPIKVEVAPYWNVNIIKLKKC